MKEIASAQNPNFRRWESLLESRGARKEGQFLLSGRKIVPELLTQRPDSFAEILIHDLRQLEGLFVPRHLHTFLMPKRLFNLLDVFGTDFPLAVGILPSLPTADLALAPKGLEVLCGLSDPGNVGGLLRSAEAFGVRQVTLLKESAFAFHPKVVKASSGSALRLNLALGPSIHELNEVKNLVALDARGKDLKSFSWPKSVRLLVGQEGLGLPANLPEVTTLAIPINDAVDSLNALVASSIALYSYRLTCPLNY